MPGELETNSMEAAHTQEILEDILARFKSKPEQKVETTHVCMVSFGPGVGSDFYSNGLEIVLTDNL